MERKRSTLTFVAMLLAAVALVASACSSSDTPTLDTEDAGATDAEIAPDFIVPTADGGTFSLDAHLASDGRPIFLNLWASWCFPCREEMPAIDQASKMNPEVAFVGVSVQDTTSEAYAFLDEVNVTYTVGFDEDGAVDGDYRPLGLPASYIISSDGVILERIFGKVTEDDLAEKFATHFG